MKNPIWLTITLVGIIIILAFLLFRKPSMPTDLPILIARNDSLKTVITKTDSLDRIRIAAITLHDSVQSRKLDSALHIIARGKDSLKQAKNAPEIAVDDLGAAIDATLDTTLIHKYDSVHLKIAEAYRVVQDFSSNTDSVIRLFDSEISYKDSIIGIQDSEIKSLKIALTTSVLNFDGLQKDNNKLQKNIKRQSVLTKIGTTLGVVFGYVVGHSFK